MAMKTEFSPVKRPGQMLVSVFSRGRREFHEHDDKDSNEPEKEEMKTGDRDGNGSFRSR